MIVEELLATLGVQLDVKSFAEAEGGVNKLKAAIAAVGAAAGLHAIEKLVDDVVQIGDEAGKSSQKLGVAASTLLELGHVARLADVSQSGLEHSLTRLARGLDTMATKGKGPAADALNKLHISAASIKGQKIDAVFETIAEAMSKLPDGPQKTAIAMQLFGRAGTQLIPILNGGRTEIQKLRQDARDLGIVMSEETVKRFGEFDDTQKELKEVWRGLKTTAVTELLPVLQEMVSGMIEWIKANQDAIRTGIQVAIGVLVTAFNLLGAIVKIVLLGFQQLGQFWREHRDLALVLGGLIVAVLVPAMYAWAAAMLPVAAEFFIINAPIIAVMAAVAGLILIINNWGKISEVVSRAVRNAWSTLVEAIKDAWNWISNHLDIVAIVAPWVAVFVGLGPLIVDGIAKAVEFLIDKGKEYGKRLWDAIKTGIEDGIKTLPGKIWDAIKSAAVAPVFVPPTVPGSTHQSASLSGVDRVPLSPFAAAMADSDEGSSSGLLSATFGDTNITVQAGPGLDEGRVAELTAKRVAEAQRTMLRDAHDNLKGGGP